MACSLKSSSLNGHCAAWTYRHSSCDEDTHSGNEGNWQRRSRCPGAAGYLSGSNLPLSGGFDRIHRPGQTSLPVCGESGEECHWRAYEARLDANDASGQVPGGTQRSQMALSFAGRADGDSDWAGSETRRSTRSAARLSTSSLSQVERQRCMQQNVRQEEGEAGMDMELEVLTDTTANFGTCTTVLVQCEYGTWT